MEPWCGKRECKHCGEHNLKCYNNMLHATSGLNQRLFVFLCICIIYYLNYMGSQVYEYTRVMGERIN